MSREYLVKQSDIEINLELDIDCHYAKHDRCFHSFLENATANPSQAIIESSLGVSLGGRCLISATVP
jgi:hypothetical protein